MTRSDIIKFNYIVGNSPVGIEGTKEDFWNQATLQAKLVLEEAQEQYDACLERDLVEVVDGACDVWYLQTYLDTLLEAVGVYLPEARDMVCQNNNAKYTTSKDFAAVSASEHSESGVLSYVETVKCSGETYYVVKRMSDGKVLKLIGHEKPNIADAIPEDTIQMLSGE